jgi:hypothetical protein
MPGAKTVNTLKGTWQSATEEGDAQSSMCMLQAPPWPPMPLALHRHVEEGLDPSAIVGQGQNERKGLKMPE